MSDTEEKPEDLRDANVVTKYKKAAEIANAALAHVISQCAAGKKVLDLCMAGDAFIVEQTSKVYNKGKIEKGVGFPTCISVNNVVGHYSPLPGDEATLADGDMVKIDLGVFVDGYCAVVAHTLVLGADVIKGRQADVIAAAYHAGEAAARLLKEGGTNTEISEVIAKVAKEFNVNPMQGILSHQMERFNIDGEKIISNKIDLENKLEEIKFEANEVYAIDILMSTGEGKPQESEQKTTVYRRQDTKYQLKIKASRATYSEVTKKFPYFPFNIRNIDEKNKMFGIKECLKHELVEGYPVLLEKEGDMTAHFKFTALCMPSGTTKETGIALDLNKLECDNEIKDEDLKNLLAQKLGKKKKRRKKKKKKAPEAVAE